MSNKAKSVFVIIMSMLLTSSAVPAGSISGRVLKYSDGAGLENAWVTLLQGDDPSQAGDDAWDWVDSTTTNANGEYQFTNLETRMYRVQVNSQKIAGNAYFEEDLYNIPVVAGQETPNMDLHLKRAGIIYGYVNTADGTPIPNAEVHADAAWTQYGESWHSARTDLDGRYELLVAPSPGEFYPVTVRDAVIPGTTYNVYGGFVYIDGEDGYHPEHFGYDLLGEAETTDTFSGAYLYYVIVADEWHLAKVDTVQGSSGIYYPSWNTGNTEGWENLGGPPDGNFASVGYGWGYNRGYLLIEPDPGNTSLTVYIVDDSRAVEPVYYQNSWDGNFHQATLDGAQGPNYQLDISGTITGRVVNEAGVGIEDVQIGSQWNSQYHEAVETRTDTDADGYFQLVCIPAGTNYVYVENGWQDIEQGGIKYAVGEAHAGPIDLSAGATVDAGVFTIYQAGTITGIVTDQAGLSVPDADVEIEGADIDGNWAARDDVITDDLGRFTIDYVAPGTYVLECYAEGFVPGRLHDVMVGKGASLDVGVVLSSAGNGADISGTITNYSQVAAHDSQGVQLPYYEDNDYDEYGLPEFGILAISMERTYTERDYLDIDAFLVNDVEEEDIRTCK